jgi:hypothetical protein
MLCQGSSSHREEESPAIPLKIRAPGFAGRSIESFFKRSHKVIVALTVQEILEEQIAKKLAQADTLLER